MPNRHAEGRGYTESAERIAKALGGHQTGNGWLCRCPVPTHGKGHGDKHPSLSVSDGDTTLLMHCFGGCDHRDILAELQRRGLTEVADYRPGTGKAQRSQLRRPVRKPDETPQDPDALRLWMQSVPISGTSGETYLQQHRGVTPPYPQSVRFVSQMWAPDGNDRPAIIAAVSRPDRKIIAVQCTFLTTDGQKAPIKIPRMTIGKLGTGAVRLARATDVLGLAEGLETALGAMQLSGVPTWAVLGAQRLSTVSVPDAVKTIHIFTDNDGPGRRAADRAADLLTREGRHVSLRFPPDGDGDYNDTLLRLAREVTA